MSEKLPPLARKRIIVCCDGTWQNADNGYVEPTSSDPAPKLQIPSNVTRISRCFKRRCSDGTFQIVYYQSGVGSRAGLIDRILGGAFGIGIAENIREAYAYICANYVDGDEIILVGFSRGAFTARSVGGMISDLGLLTREGMDYFYPVFRDMQNWMNPDYKDPFPNLPFPDKPKGSHADDHYRKRLVAKGYTRVKQNKGQGDVITVKAIGVWDTVGALGIPNIDLLSKIGIQRYRFYNTNLSHKIQHGFHALALDETRGPFSPTLWEKNPERGGSSDLRQVWFPGSHKNVGGGWEDQGVANSTLAWMMDQLASVDVEFLDDGLDRLFEENVRYYQTKKPDKTTVEKCTASCSHRVHKEKLPWAIKSIVESNEPVRPWSLQAIRSAKSPLYDIAGKVTRSPGMYRKVNPDNGRRLKAFLNDTNERIHSSVRVRLACEGLGLGDSDLWHCLSLLKHWRPRLVADEFSDPVSKAATWGPQTAGAEARITGTAEAGNGQPSTAEGSIGLGDVQILGSNAPGGQRWAWEYVGPEIGAPNVKMIIEENLGPFEKHLLRLSAGELNVHQYAGDQDPTKFKALHSQHRALKKAMKLKNHQKHKHKKQKSAKSG